MVDLDEIHNRFKPYSNHSLHIKKTLIPKVVGKNILRSEIEYAGEQLERNKSLEPEDIYLEVQS